MLLGQGIRQRGLSQGGPLLEDPPYRGPSPRYEHDKDPETNNSLGQSQSACGAEQRLSAIVRPYRAQGSQRLKLTLVYQQPE